jgi:translation initiation factor 1|tara:strand:+ start:195 stop:557 length:363 start_codon:yes stop_codon:yes gene_type:complete
MSLKSNKNSRLVYSTEIGKTCSECENAIADCTCSEEMLPQGDGIVRVSLDTKGRKGKGVSLIKGLPLKADDLKVLAKELKQKCGVGGSVKDGNIEIQGDHRDLLITLLKAKSYIVKKSGG